jgi:hypothetical protein
LADGGRVGNQRGADDVDLFTVGLPCAIVALVYASKVEGLRLQGRLIEAASASGSAKLWMIISFALSGLLVIGSVVVLAIFMFSSGFGGFTP